MMRIDTLEVKVERPVNLEHRDSSTGFVTHMEQRVGELDNSQKLLMHMIIDLSKDLELLSKLPEPKS